jgi:hypothetical protein
MCNLRPVAHRKVIEPPLQPHIDAADARQVVGLIGIARPRAGLSRHMLQLLDERLTAQEERVVGKLIEKQCLETGGRHRRRQFALALAHFQLRPSAPILVVL